MFAETKLDSRAVLLDSSSTDERVWIALHADRGPYLVGVWYRPPSPGNTAGAETFKAEFLELREQALGTIVLGDLNVHNRTWL